MLSFTARSSLLALSAAFLSYGAAVDPNNNTQNVIANGINWYGIANNGATYGQSGLQIADAERAGFSFDAFDGAGVLIVNGTQYVAPSADLTGNLYTGGALPVGSLSVVYSLYFDASTGFARAIATITNTSGLAIATQVQWLTNAGSDGGTAIIGSQSGDTLFTTADRWVANDDGNPAGSDPSFVLSFFGSGAAITPSSVATSVFLASGTEGYGATYNLNIGAGQTVRLMWVLAIGGTTAEGQALGPTVDGINAASSVLAGLSSEELASIQNYNFGGQPQSGVPEPSTVLLSAAGLALAATRVRRK
jgi:hypothetical protein